MQRVHHIVLAAALSLGGAVGCGPEYPERSDRYDGPVDPCDVEVRTGAAEGAESPAGETPAPQFWRPGPHEVWNTSPLDRCNDDPTIDQVGEQRDVRIYVTYPTPTSPTQSGQGTVAAGRWPVIVFAHANNDSQCNIYRDYWSLHDHWASWGFVVVAVDGTYTNCRPGSYNNIVARKDGQLAALRTLAELDEDPESRFFERLDLERVVFAGHSRGGGSSLVAAREHGSALGVIDIQGIDLTAFGFGSEPIEGFPVVGFTAGEDVDLNYPLVEPTEDQVDGDYTWVNIFGGIHAYTADAVPIEPDDEPFIPRTRQHDITELYSTAFLARYVLDGYQRDAESVLYTHDGARQVEEHISPLGVQQRWRSPHPRTLIDDFDGRDPDTNALGGQNISEGLNASEETWTYRPRVEEPRRMYRKAVSRRLVADMPGSFSVGVSGQAILAPDGMIQARVKGPDFGEPASFDVRVVFDDGREATVDGHEYIGPAPLLNRFTQLVISGDELDVSESTPVERVVFEAADGTLFVDDLRIVQPQ